MEQQQRQETGQATVRDLLAVVFRQKWVILTVFLVTTASVFLLNLRTPTTYESTARIRVERGRPETSLRPTLQVLPWSEEISSEIETVKSYPVAQRAQEIVDTWYEEGLVSDPIRLNRGGVSAGVIGESNVIEVSYQSQDAAVCRPVADAVARAYTEFRRKSFGVPESAAFFNREIEQVDGQLKALQEEKEDYLGRIGAGGVNVRENNLGNLLGLTEKNMLELDNEISELERKLVTAKELVRQNRLDAAFFTQLRYGNASTLNNLSLEYMRARLTRDGLAATMTDKHPTFMAAEQKLNTAETLLRNEIQATLGIMEEEYKVLTDRRDQLVSQAAGIKSELVLIPQIKVELDRLDTELEQKQDEYKELRSNQLLTQINQATSPDYTVTLLSPAGSPYAKKTKDYVRMALAPLMSLVVGFLLAFFLDSLDHSLRTSTEVEQHLGLPVLASLPDSKD